MASLFLLALILILWQALRIKPALQPAFMITTKGGEQITPVAVPSWRPFPALPQDVSERLSYLERRSVAWQVAGAQDIGARPCEIFVRLSSQHWVRRPVSPTQLSGLPEPWRNLYFPVDSFLDDDNGDGDPLDDGELRQAGPGAEVEIFCGGFR